MPRLVVPMRWRRRILAHGVELAMQRQDQGAFSAMRRLSGVTATPCFLSCGDLVEQRLRIDHHAVADDRQLAAAHHAGRQQRQLVGDRRRSPACGRHCGRPGSGRRYRPARTASRRSCPCLRRPTGTRLPPHSPSDDCFPAPAFRTLDAGSRRPGPPSDKGSSGPRQGRTARPASSGKRPSTI